MQTNRFLLFLFAGLLGTAAWAQSGDVRDGGQLDPAAALSPAALESAHHQPLPEQYIWTAHESGGVPRRDAQLTTHYFRREFELKTVPQEASLYLAGPRRATVWVNGKKVGAYELNLDAPLGIRTYTCDVRAALRPGRNAIAIEAVRGPDSPSGGSSLLSEQQTAGKVLVVKIVPAARALMAPALVMSDASWRSTATLTDGWEQPGFDDRSWPVVESLGGIESSVEFLQWNADAGLYDWPGYDGISPFLAQYPLRPTAVTHVYAGVGQISGAAALSAPSGGVLEVSLPREEVGASEAPQIVLDFGREVVGRLEFDADADAPGEVTVQYGESMAELLKDPYLGENAVYVAPHGTAYGPKSAFRYALVRFTDGRALRFRSVALAGIAYPVRYQGSFESSDNSLNRVWAVGAYTAHLCMQDGIWDAPKRDRGRWMGDLDVSGRTIEDAFGDRFLMEDTLDRLLGPEPVKGHVNGIAGYSAFWVTGEKEYYLRSGSVEQLQHVHTRMVELLDFMEGEMNEQTLFVDKTQTWPFVDWSPELYGDSAETRRATQMEYLAAFSDGAYLLRQLKDAANAERFEHEAVVIRQAAQAHLRDASGAFGTRWQTNAFAVLSGAAEPAQYDAIWRNALSTVGQPHDNSLIISPYYGYYVITAMAKMGHRAEALRWIRQYWGGMLDEGATSFWEGYDPSWYKDDFHASLEADAMSGYRVSLAHGWSSGVAPWLMEQVLGIEAQGPGFSEVAIRPDLLGLAWVRGAEPTPRGLLRVEVHKEGSGYRTVVDLPPGTLAHLSVPSTAGNGSVLVNGAEQKGVLQENATRVAVVLREAGHYELKSL